MKAWTVDAERTWVFGNFVGCIGFVSNLFLPVCVSSLMFPMMVCCSPQLYSFYFVWCGASLAPRIHLYGNWEAWQANGRKRVETGFASWFVLCPLTFITVVVEKKVCGCSQVDFPQYKSVIKMKCSWVQ